VSDAADERTERERNADGSPDAAPAAHAPADDARSIAHLEALGWVGMALLLAAYAAVSFDLVARDAPLYVGVNVLGAALVAVICAVKRAWPAFALEIAWIALSVPALWSAGA